MVPPCRSIKLEKMRDSHDFSTYWYSWLAIEEDLRKVELLR